MANNIKNNIINVAIIKASWHKSLIDTLTKDCKEQLNIFYSKKNVALNILEYSVPGSVELPVTAKLVAETNNVQVIICIGIVLKGESDHYTHVANQVSYGCQKVAIDTSIPVIFGVLTCQSLSIAEARVTGEHSKSGIEWAKAAIDMIELIDNIKKVNIVT